jgi:putative ABC transport system ATP-binding protein
MAGAKVILSDVSRSYGSTCVLRDITFTVQPGELVALTGPSGSGKTTLLQLIGSLDKPTTGTIQVDDVAVHELRHPARFRREAVGFVFQLHYLLPALTATQNIELTLVAAHVHKREREQRARELLQEVGLESRAAALPSDLSGGERQRVAIARALAGSPRLLLADEPTGSLDSESTHRVWDLITEVRETHGMTVIVASHDQTLVARTDRSIELHDGKLAAAGVETV